MAVGLFIAKTQRVKIELRGDFKRRGGGVRPKTQKGWSHVLCVIVCVCACDKDMAALQQLLACRSSDGSGGLSIIC